MTQLVSHSKAAWLVLVVPLLLASAAAAATFSVKPAAVGNTYTGSVTLQIGGLSNGGTVLVQKYLDANRNGKIDAGDVLWQQFKLTDGQASTFDDGTTLVTNLDVPGDMDTTSGRITSTFGLGIGGFEQTIVAKYLFRLSSPAGAFAALTNSFSVTNPPFAQSVSGVVKANGTNLPGAIVLLFEPSSGNKLNPQAGVLADGSGNYMLSMPAGDYLLAALKDGFIASLATSAQLALGSGALLHTNLSLVAADRTISGSVVDSGEPGTVLPGVFLPASSDQGLLTIAFSDTKGNFTAGVTAGTWRIDADEQSLAFYGYVRPGQRVNLDATSGSVSGVQLALPKATALFYGSVKDAQGHPLAGVSLWSSDNDGQYEETAVSDANGDYFAGAMAGASDDWQVQIESDSAPSGYVFSVPAVQQNGGVALSAGQAMRVDFTGLPALNHITGRVQDSDGKPVSGVGVNASATINGQQFEAHADTDSTGQYSLNVANGNWDVNLNCGDGGDGLNNVFGNGNYLCPDGQGVAINNNNGTADFTVLLAGAYNHITGRVQDSSGNPISGVGVNASATINGQQVSTHADTDQNGGYSLSVANGNWNVSLNCGGGGDGLDNILGSGNYQCPNSQNVTISDRDGSANFSVQTAQSLQITTTSLPDGTVGTFYTQQLQATGGTPPYFWWLPGGSITLPPGVSGDMSFSSDGTISGTPGKAGTYTFWVGLSVNNPYQMVTQQLSLTITSSAGLQISTTSLPDGTVGVPYSAPLSASGGQAPYIWQLALGSAAPPDGLSINPDGSISGVPTASQTSTFIVQVTDSSSQVLTKVFSISIKATAQAPSISSPAHLANGQFQMMINGSPGQNYTVQMSADLNPGSWTSLLVTNAPNGSFEFIDPNATATTRFYRILIGP
jgi:Putative Ig domain